MIKPWTIILTSIKNWHSSVTPSYLSVILFYIKLTNSSYVLSVISPCNGREKKRGKGWLDKDSIVSVVILRGQNEDTQTREVGGNEYITITEQIYRIQVLYNS